MNTKRINKTKDQLVNEVKQKEYNDKKRAFLKEYEENHKALGEKYGMIMVPIIRYTEFGIQPVFAVDVYKPPALEVSEQTTSTNDLDTQSETNPGADSND